MWVRIALIMFIVIFIFVTGFLCGIVSMHEPGQRERDDKEQEEYLKKWEEKNETKNN